MQTTGIRETEVWNVTDLDISSACKKGWIPHLDLNEVLPQKTSLPP
jgi:hypothetical protein